jgi:hypothetical protein
VDEAVEELAALEEGGGGDALVFAVGADIAEVVGDAGDAVGGSARAPGTAAVLLRADG